MDKSNIAIPATEYKTNEFGSNNHIIGIAKLDDDNVIICTFYDLA